MARITKTDRAKALAKVPMFENLSKKHLLELARNTTEVEVPAGTEIAKEGTHGHEAYFIVSGSVDVRRSGRKLTTLKAGEIVGEMSLLDREARSASCVTATDCVLLVMSTREFTHLQERVPAVSRKLLVTLSKRLREADRTIAP